MTSVGPPVRSARLFESGAQTKSNLDHHQISHAFPCHATNVDKAISPGSPLRSQVRLRGDMVPILQMGHGNRMGCTRGGELASKPSCGRSVRSATVPLGGSRAKVQRSPDTACQHSCQMKQQKNRARAKLSPQTWRSKQKQYKETGFEKTNKQQTFVQLISQ